MKSTQPSSILKYSSYNLEYPIIVLSLFDCYLLKFFKQTVLSLSFPLISEIYSAILDLKSCGEIAISQDIG